MSFPAVLRPAALSAYREILRSARITFQGDLPRRLALTSAVRAAFESPTLEVVPPSSSSSSSPTLSESSSPNSNQELQYSETAGSDVLLHDPENLQSNVEAPLQLESESLSEEELAKRIQGWKEVALFLRKNVVQGEKDEQGNWRLRVTKDTELGSNETVKEPPKLPTTPFPNRNRRKREPSSSS
ncbi:hypothetical protein BCR39DRAFT_535059 [Naematelia encephala]|uniref:Mitochondrial zinc maintenance protein 1, mitochondrial n=1 Tax=Naematelia encephala TaxID=71784 RepID=A0A1Y2B355_9TREE|nr:hypothetical protein BCR39DRAFT_535059 [Naematelia encephala]